MKDSKNLRIAVFGTHKVRRQPSMELFARWLNSALTDEFEVYGICAPTAFFNSITSSWPLSKWLYYIDQYLISSVMLLFTQFRYDVIIIADHANAPSATFVSRSRLCVMVHDTISIRSSLGELEPALPRPSLSGKLLQNWTLFSIRKAKCVLVNPGPVARELLRLGVNTSSYMVGCPLDRDRWKRKPQGLSSRRHKRSEFFLYVGNDIPRKRQSVLLNFWSYVEKEVKNVELLMVGHSNYSTRELANELELSTVRFLGSVNDDELYDLYLNCKGLITASELEGFCLPVLEVIAAGKFAYTSCKTDFFSEIFGNCIKPILNFDQPNAHRFISEINNNICSEFFVEREHLLNRYSFEAFSRRLREALRAEFY